MTKAIDALMRDIRGCRVCRDTPKKEPGLPQEPNPIFQFHPDARILLASQAPGLRAHNSSTPFLDPSGVRLREWLQLDMDEFYDPTLLAIVPMGFCFPGYDKNGGDLPPRKECAPLWREHVLKALGQVELILAVGSYSQKWHLRENYGANMTETVMRWRELADGEGGGQALFPLPHPSWRNNHWLKKNPWFEEALLPALQDRIRAIKERMN